MCHVIGRASSQISADLQTPLKTSDLLTLFKQWQIWKIVFRKPNLLLRVPSIKWHVKVTDCIDVVKEQSLLNVKDVMFLKKEIFGTKNHPTLSNLLLRGKSSNTFLNCLNPPSH